MNMKNFIEILKIILPAIITGFFTFFITKYNYSKNVPLDKMEISYNKVYYPLYKIIYNNKEYKQIKNIKKIIKQISFYINKHNMKYIDRSTYNSFILLKDKPNKDNYNNFKNNIYDRNSYLRRRLGYLEPNFIQSVKYLSKDDKFIFYCAVDGLIIYILFVVSTIPFFNENIRYFFILFGMVFVVILFLKIIFKVIFIGISKMIKFVRKMIKCIMNKCD